jgi:hypothetical protein
MPETAPGMMKKDTKTTGGPPWCTGHLQWSSRQGAPRYGEGILFMAGALFFGAAAVPRNGTIFSSDKLKRQRIFAAA